MSSLAMGIGMEVLQRKNDFFSCLLWQCAPLFAAASALAIYPRGVDYAQT